MVLIGDLGIIHLVEDLVLHRGEGLDDGRDPVVGAVVERLHKGTGFAVLVEVLNLWARRNARLRGETY